jgi:hypothetical protein
MSPKWATREQEEFLEDRYGIYRQVKYRRKWPLFKEFWISVKSEWVSTFGWTTADDVDEPRVPCLEKVNCKLVFNAFDWWRLTENAANQAMVQQQKQGSHKLVSQSNESEKYIEDT